MDRQEMERCLEHVRAYRASGQKANVWGEANGVPVRALASWCAHSRRWQAKLDGVSAVPGPRSGFLAARVASVASASVRIDLHAGATRLELHWPLAHTGELTALLRDLGR